MEREPFCKEKFQKEVFQEQVRANVRNLFQKEPANANMYQLYFGVAWVVRSWIAENWCRTKEHLQKEDEKILYYLSVEFLPGKLLGMTLQYLGLYENVSTALQEMGICLAQLEEQEVEPALGSGGLGRLAVCFLDSLSTLGYPVWGCGIRYRYGMLRQKIIEGCQVEQPDDWLQKGYPFESCRAEETKEVRFGGWVTEEYCPETGKARYVQTGCRVILAVPYDMPVMGYRNSVVNTLRLWDARGEIPIEMEAFERGEYDKATEQERIAKRLVEILYPGDFHESGKALRLQQQYFFVSASIQTIVERHKKKYGTVGTLSEKVVVQMNDTHPTLAIPELMRLLLDEEGLSWEEAWEITTHTCAYTNHTVMEEALERWPVELFASLLPRIYQIVEELNRRWEKELRKQGIAQEQESSRMAILWKGQVCMANMAVMASFSVNGVAKLHTEILKEKVFKEFFARLPEKFHNKTNGISQRRFLLHGNPLLAQWLTERLGDGWITDLSQLKGLLAWVKDPVSQREFREIKGKNKERLANYVWQQNKTEVNLQSVFDVQAKRIHEYKRQLLNVLHIMYLFNRWLQNPEKEMLPRTVFFSGKAAAGYVRAKKIIELIHAVAEVIYREQRLREKLQVVFVEDYKVHSAELFISGAEISEQISTASKEASGTGNMKFMLNGAVTLGTRDGANLELVQEVGENNAFLFGLSAQEVTAYERQGNYEPREYYERDGELRQVLEQLIDGTYGEKNRFSDLYDSLLVPQNGMPADPYFVLADFRSYVQAQQCIEKAYQDEAAWSEMAMRNVACCGKFSADRTIEEYVTDIWKIKKLNFVRKF